MIDQIMPTVLSSIICILIVDIYYILYIIYRYDAAPPPFIAYDVAPCSLIRRRTQKGRAAMLSDSITVGWIRVGMDDEVRVE
jgi:hypothetical protein